MLSESEVARLIQQPEGQFLERKTCYEYVNGNWKLRKTKDVAKNVAETLSAFANADGGTLLLGVDDNGNVSGVDYSEDKLTIIQDTPKRLIRPPLRAEVNKVNFQRKRLLIFTVPWMPDVYQMTDGRYLLRIGDSSMPFPAEQIELLKSGKRKAVFESHIESTASWNDILESLVIEFGKKTGINKGAEEILQEYRLIEYDNGNPRFKLATLLLFGKDPLKWHSRCGVDFVKYEGTERKVGRELNIIKRTRIELPLTKLIEETYKVILPHIKERQYLYDLFFTEKLEYPTFAWQEAIVNAVAHRDYSIQGLSIEVWMLDDRIEIRSPGLPPEPVTLNKILKRERIHVSRNPLIVRVLTELGYMRETGEGIPRMFDEMETNGLYPPKIEIVADSLFSVTLKNQPVYSVKDMEWLRQFNDLNLIPEQKKMLLFARAHGVSFTSKDYQKVCNVDIYTASKDIKEMIRKGIIALPQKGGRVYRFIYPLKEKKVVNIPDEYPIIEELIQKQGYVKNKDIRQAFRISRLKAVRLAQKLVDLGLLKMIGKKKGSIYTKPE